MCADLASTRGPTDPKALCVVVFVSGSQLISGREQSSAPWQGSWSGPGRPECERHPHPLLPRAPPPQRFRGEPAPALAHPAQGPQMLRRSVQEAAGTPWQCGNMLDGQALLSLQIHEVGPTPDALTMPSSTNQPAGVSDW